MFRVGKDKNNRTEEKQCQQNIKLELWYTIISQIQAYTQLLIQQQHGSNFTCLVQECKYKFIKNNTKKYTLNCCKKTFPRKIWQFHFRFKHLCNIYQDSIMQPIFTAPSFSRFNTTKLLVLLLNGIYNFLLLN